MSLEELERRPLVQAPRYQGSSRLEERRQPRLRYRTTAAATSVKTTKTTASTGWTLSMGTPDAKSGLRRNSYFQPGTRPACSIHVWISGRCASSRVVSFT